MLVHLSIHQFALVDHLELEVHAGMSVITGETGAGKSILLDALGLTLGDRADADCVRQGADKAEIAATFSMNPQASLWLQQRDIPVDDDCIILRRIVSVEGRSRGYINGRPAAAADLKDLGQLLIEIHSQHAHQRLLQKETPRQLVDAFGGLSLQVSEVSLVWSEWQQLAKKLATLKEESAEVKSQRQLLTYQVEELRELSPGEEEIPELESEQKRLSNAEGMLLSGQYALAACYGDDNGELAAVQLAQQAIARLNEIDDQHPLLNEARDLLVQAQIQLDEAGRSLQHYLDLVDINPHRLQQVESRLSDLYRVARKHQIQPEQLYNYWQEQEAALAELNLSDDDLAEMEQQAAALEREYRQLAATLSESRREAAARMDAEVEAHFEALALGRAKFVTHFDAVDEGSASRHGIDRISFNVQTNPGMPAGALAKVASGGELARISLAIQVVTAAVSDIPSLIFDEVDVGIGGGTAERVGRLLRSLGKDGQVLCVTHQPQVAAQANQHYQVSKISGDTATHTQLRKLNSKQRSEEIARMLGGVDITRQTLAHAEEMLALVK